MQLIPLMFGVSVDARKRESLPSGNSWLNSRLYGAYVFQKVWKDGDFAADDDDEGIFRYSVCALVRDVGCSHAPH